jgi:hypothetical protein
MPFLLFPPLHHKECMIHKACNLKWNHLFRFALAEIQSSQNSNKEIQSAWPQYYGLLFFPSYFVETTDSFVTRQNLLNVYHFSILNDTSLPERRFLLVYIRCDRHSINISAARYVEHVHKQIFFLGCSIEWKASKEISIYSLIHRKALFFANENIFLLMLRWLL